jgi:hypothetical protein
MFYSCTKVSERTLAEKLTKAEKKVYSTYFAEGAHSIDNTGEQSEADFPLYVRLFEDFFTWKASSLPGHTRERDIQLRDQRRHRSHLIVGAQVSRLVLCYLCYTINL